MIILNLKTYQKSLEDALLFTDIASEVVEETGVRIIVSPPQLYLREASERFSDVFAQHVDWENPGSHTGSVPAELLKISKIKGSLVNHSEKRIGNENIKKTVEKLSHETIESIVCAENINEVREIAGFGPTGIAIEPPELIGSGISVSNAKPEIITDTVNAVREVNDKVKVLCGAGIGTKEDVKKSLELGAEGVLLASAFVKSNNPKAFLTDLASVF